ncbi:Sec-independent protein translocase protein TatB [Sphingomonas montanisoli]|uniref:Sec-independent protein translocase protein TatB n=1 Tax=Sphingomonas montanisoli TaxID=2606412 RepID=UPI003CCC76FA
MFDIAPTELLLVAVVALVVIGPKDLPRAMRFVGQWIAKARGVARHFRSGIDEMIRQSELEEMEKKWAAENERIMREHPVQTSVEHSAPGPVDDDGQMLPIGHVSDARPDGPADPVEAPHPDPKTTPLP